MKIFVSDGYYQSYKLALIIHIKLFLLEICVKIKRFLEFSRQGLSIGNLRISHRKNQQSKDLMERPESRD